MRAAFRPRRSDTPHDGKLFSVSCLSSSYLRPIRRITVATMDKATLTVAEVASALQRAVDHAFPAQVWVRGEIRDLSRASSGHVYFSLVDPSHETETDVTAVLPVTLFRSDKEAVNNELRRAGAMRMVDGMEVRVRGRLGFYPPRGTVQLRMTAIDTDFTLSRLAAERDRLLRRLAADGLLERNASLRFPAVPLRVGLVTSVGSAAYADFLHGLTSSGFAWRVSAANARVQGMVAGPELVAAITDLSVRGVDVIAIVRGGGSPTDLAVFNHELVVRAVATAPVPVVTGIGHEIDETLCDRVAAIAFKTPTACAAGLVQRVEAFVGGLDRLGDRIRSAAEVRLAAVSRHLSATSGRLTRGGQAVARRLIDRTSNHESRLAGAGFRLVKAERHAIAAATPRLTRSVGRSLERADQRLRDRSDTVAAFDPTRTLQRGWSVTRDDSGRLVRHPRQVSVGAALSTELAMGTIESRVELLRENPGS